MQLIIDDFEQRVKEVHGYLRMLKAMNRSDSTIFSSSKPSHKSTPIDDDWRKVSKATVYLLIYNLVESAIRSSFSHLYMVIASEQRSVNLVSDQIRDIWILSEHKKLTRETASPYNYRKAAARMVLDTLNQEVVRLDSSKLPISGNLDADTIRDVCQKHGVSVRVHPAAKGGTELGNIKEQRNALAHGIRSFTEVGRDITVDDLSRTARQTEIFVRSILRNISNYIAKGNYASVTS